MITNCKKRWGILRNTNKKKGFTLIELLAVIVILAIIALIATPIILNMINDAKKSAAKDSAYGYIEAIEYNNSMASLDSKKYPLVSASDVATINSQVKVKGTIPTKGTVTITSGIVTEADLCINNYSVHYNGKEATIEGDTCNGTSKPIEYIVFGDGTAVYYNPIEGKKCTDYTETNSAVGIKTGCMKFYTFNDEGKNASTVNMILDHNTTAKVAWNSSRKNANGPSLDEGQVMDKLKKDTEGWTGVTTRTDKYEFKSDKINYTIDYNGYKARLITADEIAKITNNEAFIGATSTDDKWFYLDGKDTKWHEQVANATTKSKYAWLYDYTRECTSYGCNTADSSNDGYWTSTPVTNYSTYAWSVLRYGDLEYYKVYTDSDFGVRPVITIEKSKIS